VILVITLLGGLLGGLLGNTFWTVDLLLHVLAVLGGTAIGTGVAFFLLTVDRPVTRRWSPQPEPSQPLEPTRPSWPAVQTRPARRRTG
jgi:hypothetical protein